MISNSMEVDSGYNGDPTAEQIMELDAEETGQEIRRRIGAKVDAARRLTRPSDPLIKEPLVPRDLAESTFKLPAVEQILREFLPLEEAVNELLSPQINWAPPGYKPTDRMVRRALARLWAIRTDGDGDCLLHAVSLSLWGQHDRTLVLRSLVVEVLLDKPSEKTLFHVWREGQQRADAAAGDSASFQMEEDQVIAEWHMLVQAAKTPSAYLSSFHAFVLANALRRPILVYGDRFVRGRNGEPYAPSDVRGVYLPTLVDPDVCYKLPIAVGYTCVAVGKVGHFTALVGVDRELRHLPLVDEHGDDLPIRYGLPPATVANPRPEEDFLEDYLMTTLFYTEEGKQYPMAVLRGAYMTPEAADVRAAMAQTAVTAFDRLAKEQEEEIKRALLASEGENDNPPTPTPTPTPPATADGDGDNQGPTPSPPGPPVLSPPSEAKLPPPPPPPATTATKNGDGLSSWSGSSTADLSDGPTAGLFVDDGNGGRKKGAVAGGGGPTAIAGGGGGGAAAVALRGGGAGGGEAGSAGAAPRADGAAASLSAAGYDDGGGGGGDGVGVPAGEAGRSGGEDDTDGLRARLARPESSARAEGNGGGVDGGIGGGVGEDSPPVASPPIGSRLLSAPLDMLSAVGAWATGRGRYSVGSAASDTAAAAPAVATATATAASSSLSDGGRTASSSESSISSTAAGDPPALPRSGDGVGSRTGGSGSAGDGARPGTYAGASPLDLRLDGFSGHGGGGDSGASASGRPPSVHVPGEEEDGMVLNSPPPNGNGEAEVAATTNGKRKPVCSPAVTPEGPNPGQHFGDARSTAAAAAATAAVEEDWRVANTAAAPGSRRRSRGRSSTGTAGPPPPPARRAAAVAGADDAAAAVGQEEGEEMPGEEPPGVAASVRAFAAATEAYHATERWRSARSGGAGSRRGQPHPRGSSPGGDGEAATGGRSSNPWLATSSLAIAAAERRPQGESRADEDGRRLAAGGGSSSHGGGGGGGATGARAGGEGETRPETAPPKARYHSRTRRPRGEDPSGAPVDRYPLTERGSRSVQDGIDTMSLASSIASGERRYYSSGRLPHVAAVAAGANHDFDLGGGHGGGSSSDAYQLAVAAATSPTRRRRASAAGGGTQSAGRRESSNPPPPRELSDYSLYPRSPASTTAARARRAGTGEGEARSSRGISSSSSSLSRDSGRCSLARSSSGSGGGGGVGRDVGDGFTGAGNEERERRNRGESAGYYSYGDSSYSYGARAGSSTASLSRQLSGSGRSPSPAVARPSSASRKSDHLRAAALTRPGSSSSSLSRAALTGRRSPLRTSISSSSSSVSASSYLASGKLGTAASAARCPSNVPGAVLTQQQQGLSARGVLLSRAGSGGGGGGGSVRSNGSVRSGRSYSGSCSGSNAGYGGQTLSEIRRSLAARERREVEATSVGAPRSRKAYADTPKFY